MEILLWLVPPVLVTVVAMAWVGWLGREGRGEVGAEEALDRLGSALDREPRATAPTSRPARRRVRSTGVALRRTPREAGPVTGPVTGPVAGPVAGPQAAPDDQRRAS